MSKEDVLLFGTYGMRGTGKSYYEKLKEKDKEIEKLNKGYCPIKEKCNKGECDCTNEEYNQMCEENIKLDLEIESLNNIINEFDKYLVSLKNSCIYNVDVTIYKVVSNIYDKFKEIKGVDKE